MMGTGTGIDKSLDKQIHDRVKELVAETWEGVKLRPMPAFSNRSRVINKVQEQIYYSWGFSNQYIWDLVRIYTEELISEEED